MDLILVVKLLMQLYQQKVLAVTLVYVDATQGWLVTDSWFTIRAPTAYMYSNRWNNNYLWRF